MDGNDNVAEDSGDRFGTRSRMLNKQLDEEAVLFEKLCCLQNERSGYLFIVSARRNEIDVLLSSEENVQLVKEKLPGFLAAVEKFKEAHLTYLSNLKDDISVANIFYQRIQEWIKRSEELLRLNSQINPEDSASQIGSRTTCKSSSRKSRCLSQSS